MGGRYETLLQLAVGGMATVYVGTVRGAFGFRQLVAIKRPHPHLVADPNYRRELLAEARLASLIHHANVVDVRDVEEVDEHVSLVMDYVEGASVGELLQNALGGGPKLTPAVAVRIVLDACAGLHAAHELTDERGRPVQLVHRDISPQNLLVGTDGVTRVTDFGVAKFEHKGGATTDGHLKGKLAYMAPEYLRGETIDRRFDIFAMGIVLWESLAGKRLFRGEHEADTLRRVLDHSAPPISEVAPEVGTALDAVVETALAKAREHRFENAAAMASALESSARAAGLLAGHREVAELVKASVGAKLDARRADVRARMANEPSVASVMGDIAPATIPDTTPDTRAASTLVSPNAPNPPSSPSAIKAPSGATLRSAEPSGAPMVASAVPLPSSAPVTPTERDAPNTRFPVENTARSAPPSVTDSAPPKLPVGSSRSRWLVALAALGSLAIAAAIAVARIGGPSSAATTPPAASADPATATPNATATATPNATATATPNATATANATATPNASATPTASAIPTASTTAKPRPPPHRPSPAPAKSSSDPPPNPYAK